MKTFVSILLLAVASSKAGESNNHGSSESNSESSSQEYTDYTAPAAQNYAADTTGNDHSYQPQSYVGTGNQGHFASNDYNFGPQFLQGFTAQDYQPSGHGVAMFTQSNPSYNAEHTAQSFGQTGQAQQVGHTGASFPQFQQFHHFQPRGFDLGHSGFSAPANDFQGDSYLQAAHDLGSFNHGGGSQSESGSHEEQQKSGSEEQHDHTFEVEPSGQQGHQQEQFNGHPQFQQFILQDGGSEFGHGGHGEEQHSNSLDAFDHQHVIPVGEHVDVEHPVRVPVYKHVTYPIPKTIQVNVPKPILVGVPQPYPVKVPVHKPVAVPVETEINIPVEKVVPYPIYKNVPYPVEKHVPFKVEKTVTVHVPHPYPVKIPVYKTIHHHKDH